jgi:hypothetical protein
MRVEHRHRRGYAMLEVLRYLRDNAYRTYIVTGGGRDFARAVGICNSWQAENIPFMGLLQKKTVKSSI